MNVCSLTRYWFLLLKLMSIIFFLGWWRLLYWNVKVYSWINFFPYSCSGNIKAELKESRVVIKCQKFANWNPCRDWLGHVDPMKQAHWHLLCPHLCPEHSCLVKYETASTVVSCPNVRERRNFSSLFDAEEDVSLLRTSNDLERERWLSFSISHKNILLPSYLLIVHESLCVFLFFFLFN